METVNKKQVLGDIAEIYNNLNDDLSIDEEEVKQSEGTDDVNGARLQAIKKHTLQVVRDKYKKYGGVEKLVE